MIRFQKIEGEDLTQKIEPKFSITTEKRIYGDDEIDVSKAKAGDYLILRTLNINLNILIKYRQTWLLIGDILGSPKFINAGTTENYKETYMNAKEVSAETMLSVSNVVEKTLEDQIKSRIGGHLNSETGISFGTLSTNLKSTIETELSSVLQSTIRENFAENQSLKKKLLENTTNKYEKENTWPNNTTDDWIYLPCSMKMRWEYHWFLQSAILELKDYISLVKKSFWSRKLTETNKKEEVSTVPLSQKLEYPILIQTIDQDVGMHYIRQEKYDELVQKQKDTAKISESHELYEYLEYLRRKISVVGTAMSGATSVASPIGLIEIEKPPKKE